MFNNKISQFFQEVLRIFLPCCTFLQELTIHDHEILRQAENF